MKKPSLRGGNLTKTGPKTSVKATNYGVTLKGASVNSDAVRTSPAPSPKTIGPRTA